MVNAPLPVLDSRPRRGYNTVAMAVRETPQPPLRILFVCLANLCRSPLAKAIAERALGDSVLAESAGVAPSPARIPQEGLNIIRRLTGRDASGHQPRFVLDFPLADFDYIIGMDSSVFMRLSSLPQVPQDKLYGWEISDPCGMGPDAYERTARQIEQYLDQFLLNREMEKASARKKT
jgi:protein-tyrosine-phosphatase